MGRYDSSFNLSSDMRNYCSLLFIPNLINMIPSRNDFENIFVYIRINQVRSIPTRVIYPKDDNLQIYMYFIILEVSCNMFTREYITFRLHNCTHLIKHSYKKLYNPIWMSRQNTAPKFPLVLKFWTAPKSQNHMYIWRQNFNWWYNLELRQNLDAFLLVNCISKLTNPIQIICDVA